MVVGMRPDLAAPALWRPAQDHPVPRPCGKIRRLFGGTPPPGAQPLSTNPLAPRRAGLPAALLLALTSALAGHVQHARMARAWQAALVLLLAVVLVLALAPAPPQQVNLGWDKLNHLAAFLTLACVACLALARARWQIALGLLAYGGLIELLQSLTATRTAEWADLLADGVGISLGLGMVALAALATGRAARQRTTL